MNHDHTTTAPRIGLTLRRGAADRVDWLDWRRQGIGASDVASILGVGFGTAASVLRSKLYGIDGPETDPMRWGRILEAHILDDYEAEHPEEPMDRDVWCVHPDHKWMRATLDGQTPSRVVEAKSTGIVGCEWEAGPPVMYQLQVQWQMAVTGYAVADVPVFERLSCKSQLFTVHRDDELIDDLIDLLGSWWQRYVIGGEVLPPDESEDYWQYILERHPRIAKKQKDKEYLPGSETFGAWVKEYDEARTAEDRAGAAKTTLRNRMVAVIGEADGVAGVLEDGRTYKVTFGKKFRVTVKEQK